jgi:hypothetical protein
MISQQRYLSKSSERGIEESSFRMQQIQMGEENKQQEVYFSISMDKINNPSSEMMERIASFQDENQECQIVQEQDEKLETDGESMMDNI